MVASTRYRGLAHPETRKVQRPSYEQLKADVASMSMLAVGRKYGVSDNAVRKWLRWYEHRAEARAGAEEDAASVIAATSEVTAVPIPARAA